MSPRRSDPFEVRRSLGPLFDEPAKPEPDRHNTTHLSGEVLRSASRQEAGRRLSAMLRRFGVGPSRIRHEGQESKGYRIEHLAPATMRVLGTDRGAN